MRILLQDYCGHPFQLQLAQVLAGRRHTVCHAYCGSNPGTPNALTESLSDDESFTSYRISLSRTVIKGNFIDRFRLERQYGLQLARLIVDWQPDVVILANTPIDALGPAIQATRGSGAALVVWVQDLLGEAAMRILPTRIGPLGHLIGTSYRWREKRLLATADHLVSITEDFKAFFDAAGIASDRWTTIPNWAPLDKIRPRPRENDWSREQGLDGKTVFLYSGSLGFKHNPKLLLKLAAALKDRPEAIVVVNSEGGAADWLKQEAARQELTASIRINCYQPFERMSEVLGSGDVLLALLEADAGVFSVPSKVLSNHCAARPQLLAVPPSNLAARIVAENQSGVVCDPSQEAAFVSAAIALLDEPHRRVEMGENAWSYAKDNFDIVRISGRFEKTLAAALDVSRSRSTEKQRIEKQGVQHATGIGLWRRRFHRQPLGDETPSRGILGSGRRP